MELLNQRCFDGMKCNFTGRLMIFVLLGLTEPFWMCVCVCVGCVSVCVHSVGFACQGSGLICGSPSSLVTEEVFMFVRLTEGGVFGCFFGFVFYCFVITIGSYRSYNPVGL